MVEATIIPNLKLKFRRTFDKCDNKKHFSLKTFFYKDIDKESVKEYGKEFGNEISKELIMMLVRKWGISEKPTTVVAYGNSLCGV